MKSNLIYCFIAVIVFIFDCSCNKDPIIYSQNLIKNPSFEINGQTTLQNWVVSDISLTSFSEDVPKGGAKWSLELMSGSTQGSGAFIGKIETYITGQSGTNVYQLSVWMKSLNKWPGSVAIGTFSQNQFIQQSITGGETQSWEQFILTDTLTVEKSDTIAVILSAGTAPVASGRVRFDLVQLKKLQ